MSFEIGLNVDSRHVKILKAQPSLIQIEDV